MFDADKDLLYKVAYDEAVRALSEQQETGFVGVAIASLAILWPRRWEFTASPRDVIPVYIEAPEPAPIEELHRDLSRHMHNSYLDNRNGLRATLRLLRIASGLLTVEVALWIIAIAATA